MPTSSYSSFDVVENVGTGAPTLVPSQTINVFNVTGNSPLPDIISDANGHVPAGTLPVAAGTLIRFSGSKPDGRRAYAEQVTS
jgi:hypothetical protein